MKSKTKIEARTDEIEAPEAIDEWDWLGYAIGRLGGPRKAAVAIGAPYTAIYEWLEFGLAQAKFIHVVKISELANVPLQFLVRRMGPPANEHLDPKERKASAAR